MCGTGPLLFRNQGDGTFALKRDAFKFSAPPQGSFTTRLSPTTTAMGGSMSTFASICITWDWISITIRFPITTPGTALPIASCTMRATEHLLSALKRRD